jgi:predicted ArsR family transcriptional regulator
MDRPTNDSIDRVAALGEPIRRRLYEFVARRGEPVDRDEAAAAIGIGRPLAAFHLDRLVRSGLLAVVFRRRTGKTGPGAGRPAKFYLRPAGEDVGVPLPSRSYDVAADLLARGVEGDDRARAAVLDAARRRGAALAGPTASRPLTGVGSSALEGLLEREGYEPYTEDDGTIRLRNCPFHELAATHRELTCAMNFALLDGASGAIDATGYRAQPQPRDGRCCVAFVPVSG